MITDRDEAVEKSQDKIADMKCFQLWRLIGAKDDLSWEQVCQAVCGDCRYKTSEEGACTELIAIAILDAIGWEEINQKLSQWSSYKKQMEGITSRPCDRCNTTQVPRFHLLLNLCADCDATVNYNLMLQRGVHD